LKTKENVDLTKLIKIEHGFNLENFNLVNLNAIQYLKDKYDLNNVGPIVGVISRYTNWKGIEYIISSFKQLLNTYPNAVLVLANAFGDYELVKKELLSIDKNNYREIIFESDIPSLFKLFDIFVHVPIDREIEAFGMVYVEALAAGIPSIFTLSGIANDFIINDLNAVVVDYKNSIEIYNAYNKILTNRDYRRNLIINGKESVRDRFCINKHIDLLNDLYLSN